MVYLREYAGVRLDACPGTGVSGLPFSCWIRCGDQRSSAGLRRTVATLKTPTSVPIKLSFDLISKPRYTPSDQTSSNFPGMSLVFGILK